MGGERNQRVARVVQAHVKCALVAGVVVATMCACGSSDADSGAVPAANSNTAGSPTVTEASAAPSVPVAVNSEPFVWNASADIAEFPADHYQLRDCPVSAAVREAGGTGPTDDYGPPPFPDLDTLRSGVNTVFVATVDHVDPPFTVVPINLPDQYIADTGISTGDDISWPWTPTVMSVDQVVWGDADPTVVMGELGCYAQGATAALTPGATLLVLAKPVEPTFGPFELFGGTHLIIDWFSVDDSGHLMPRAGMTGSPSTAPFLDGLDLSEALALLAAKR